MDSAIKILYDPVRAMAVKKTAKAFSISQAYVRMVLNGDRDNKDVQAYYTESYQALMLLVNA